MKNTKSIYALTTFFGILALTTTVLFSNASADSEVNKTEIYKESGDCQLPEAFMNAENMANVVADPAKFMQLINLMSSPQTAQSMMNCSTDTEQWSLWTKNLGDPTFKMNAAAVFMNPQVYMNWMTAMMNPQTFQTTMNTFMNPALYMQWMTAMSNPAYYQSMYKMMDPAWQQQSSAWMMNPANYQQMFNAFTTGAVVADATVK
ncbi:MAG: hypothetical protein AB8B89_01530 [Gammaproteobacteria bacterium]